MAESYKYRFLFPRGEQQKFIEKVQKVSALSIDRLAKIAGVNPRTLRDWRREKFLSSGPEINILSSRFNVPIPKTAKRTKAFWYVSKGARAGGKALINKYGHIPVDPEYRKKKWREWWEREGKFTPKKIHQPLHFQKPELSIDLAEFFGIMMGDGGMTPYQLKITLNSSDDFEYSRFVAKLMKNLFKVEPKIYVRPKFSVNEVVISRTGLVAYLHSLGLVIGNKIRQQIDIPDWIKNNKEYSVACLRGLVDTDGSVIRHRYRVGRKVYEYKKISFCSASKPLQKSAYRIFKICGLNPRVSQRDVRIDAKADVVRYFSVVGSNNEKHLKKYRF